VLITGHRRENFGQGFDEICMGIARLAKAFPDHRFTYPVHLNPNVKERVNRLLGSTSFTVMTAGRSALIVFALGV
jgi:UDP-N-acetylglucosamine 2-epimerase (non-hydrolysing)